MRSIEYKHNIRVVLEDMWQYKSWFLSSLENVRKNPSSIRLCSTNTSTAWDWAARASLPSVPWFLASSDPEKSHKCDYEYYGAEVLRGHFKTHRGEKLNKCSECSYASSQTGNLRRHMKTLKNVTSVTMHPLGKTNLWYSANTIRFGNIIRIRIRIYSVKR